MEHSSTGLGGIVRGTMRPATAEPCVLHPTEEKENRMKKSMCVLRGVFLVALSCMAGVLPATTFAHAQDNDKSVKQDVKDAGHSTKDATKKTGSSIKKGTKKVVNKSATKTADTADKVADKTKP
jgi:hypothetical protein